MKAGDGAPVDAVPLESVEKPSFPEWPAAGLNHSMSQVDRADTAIEYRYRSLAHRLATKSNEEECLVVSLDPCDAGGEVFEVKIEDGGGHNKFVDCATRRLEAVDIPDLSASRFRSVNKRSGQPDVWPPLYH